MSGAGIGARAFRGALWAYGSHVGGRLLVLAATAILARLLAPEDFGLVALALVFIGVLEVFKDFGVTQALIVVPDDEVEQRAETAFTFSVAVGAALSVACAALGPVAAAAFDEPDLVAILPLLGLNFLLRALGATHYALAQKRLDFRSRTWAELADAVVRGAVGIGLALAGLGAFSLVLGFLAGTIAMDAVLWAVVRWRPSLRPRRADLGSLIRFGGGLTLLDLLAAVIGYVDYAFVGSTLGTTALGLYALAWRLPELVIQNFAGIAGRVLFPAFASLPREDLRPALLLSLRATLIVCLPLGAALAALAEPAVLALFGEKWARSVEPMQILCLLAVASAVGVPAGTAYKAIGRVDVLVKLAIPRVLLLVAGLVLLTEEGIVAVAWIQAGLAAAFGAIGLWLASRLLGIGLGEIARAAWPPVVAAAALAAAASAVERSLDEPWAEVLAGGGAGVAVFAGAIWVLDRATIRELIARVRSRAPPPRGP